jgi:hypothetical protein
MPAIRRLLPALLSFGLTSAALAGGVEDAENAIVLGETSVRAGYATSYEIRAFDRAVDVFASTNSVSDARVIANGLCLVARETMRFERAFTVRVFLVSGDRPAATCKTVR